MRARASNLMIGTLALALIGGSLGGFLGYQKLVSAKQKVPFRVIFEGSASGLRKGGRVKVRARVHKLKVNAGKAGVVLPLESMLPSRFMVGDDGSVHNGLRSSWFHQSN